jgi:serine/threonine-protein kinase
VSSVEPGYLTLDTTPWSSVSLGGISLGQTPIVRAALPPGEHVLEFSNAELGVRSHYAVTITSGQTTVRRIGIEAP